MPGVSWSDQLCFWRERYAGVMVTDTAFYRYRYYHTALDTPEKVDCARLARLTEGLAAAFLRLAECGV